MASCKGSRQVIIQPVKAHRLMGQTAPWPLCDGQKMWRRPPTGNPDDLLEYIHPTGIAAPDFPNLIASLDSIYRAIQQPHQRAPMLQALAIRYKSACCLFHKRYNKLQIRIARVTAAYDFAGIIIMASDTICLRAT